MERDKAFLLGEDIGRGGAFKVTKFYEHFGEERVIDTVLRRSDYRRGNGSAVVGMRPVAEIQFADFITSGFNQRK